MPAVEITGELIITSFLLVIYYSMMIPRFSRKVTERVNLIAVVLLYAAYWWVRRHWPEIAAAQVSLWILTVPTFVLYWILSRYRGMRYIFLFSVVDIVGVVIGIWAKTAGYLFRVGSLGQMFLQIAMLAVLLLCFFLNREKLQSGYRYIEKGWTGVGLLVLMDYILLYFILLFPEPIKERKEYLKVAAVVGLVILITYWLIFRTLGDMNQIFLARQKELRARFKLNLEKEKLENEQMRMMLAQMKPHFTYNTLMTIQELCYTDRDKASELIVRFADFLRQDVDFMDCQGLAEFSREREFVEAYVRLQQARFGDTLLWEEDIRETGFRLPPFVLQPLAENAVIHGIRRKTDGGTVKLSSWKREGFIFVEISDDGIGFREEELEEKTDFSAIKNIRVRIKKLCRGSLHIESKPGEGTKVTIILPEVVEGTEDGQAIADHCGR